ncbi:MAG: glycosyltransferase, partial [Bacteroidota bacterium]
HGKKSAEKRNGYKSFEYLNEELADIYAAADVVFSRSGANSLAEISALKKPSVLIPLGTDGSRGDQILNAEKFEELGASIMILQEKADSVKVEKILLDLAGDEKKRARMGELAYEFGVRCLRAAEVIADLMMEKI